MIARSGLEPRRSRLFSPRCCRSRSRVAIPPLEMAPSEQKERTIAALIALFVGLTQGRPGPRAAGGRALDRPHLPRCVRPAGRSAARLRALLVITFRPEFAAPWVGRAHVATLSLNRFGRRQAVAMIDRVTGGKALPAEVLEQIVAKTDGVPLFVEELTKTVLESGLLREEDGGYVLASRADAARDPLDLAGLADGAAGSPCAGQGDRADRRGDRARVLLSPVGGGLTDPGAALQDALGQLMAAELIYGRGAPPEATYVFKHALVQDTAYGSLLRSRRQRIHADIARALAERFADQVESAPRTSRIITPRPV